MHKCLVCGYEWQATPANILSGTGCKQCSIKNRRKSNDTFTKELSEINPEIELISLYTGANKPIKCMCKKCKYIWNPIADSLLRGNGCPNCAGLVNSQQRFYIRFESDGNKNVELLSEYVDSLTKIQCRCKTCGYIWETTPDSLMRGSGCKKCATKAMVSLRTKTASLYKEQLAEKAPDIEVLGEYINSNTKILHRCKKCGYEWYTWPYNVLQGHGCQKCARKIAHSIKTQEMFVDELNKINSDIEILGTYTGCRNKILCKCKICNSEWMGLPTTLISRGSGCHSCSKSKGENAIEKFLKLNNIIYEPQKTFDDLRGIKCGLLSYDFYLPEYNLLIEFQGEQHEKPKTYFGGEKQLKIQQEHDNRKREYARQNNMNLLEIWYYDIDNIEEILVKTINNLKSKSVETVEVA